MSPPVHIALHAVVAAVFFFVFQFYVLGESLAISLIWGIAASCGAGYLAYSQSRRGQ